MPEDNSVLSFTYDVYDLSTLPRFNYYGNWQTTPGLFWGWHGFESEHLPL